MFKGIGDRLTVQIRGVSVCLETWTAGAEAPVEVRVEIADVDVEGVTTTAREGRKEGKRCVRLEGIGAYVIAEAALFENAVAGAAESVFGEASEATERMGQSRDTLTGRMDESTNTLRNQPRETTPPREPPRAPSPVIREPTPPRVPTPPVKQQTPPNDDSDGSSDEEVLAFAPSFSASRLRGSLGGSGSLQRPRVLYEDDDSEDEGEGGAAFATESSPPREVRSLSSSRVLNSGVLSSSRVLSSSKVLSSSQMPQHSRSLSSSLVLAPEPSPMASTHSRSLSSSRVLGSRVLVPETAPTQPPSLSSSRVLAPEAPPLAPTPLAPTPTHSQILPPPAPTHSQTLPPPAPPSPEPYLSDGSGDEMDADASRRLSESTLFTHSEAGSLYLSATSGVLTSAHSRLCESSRMKDEADEEEVSAEEMDRRLDALLRGVEKEVGTRRVRRKVFGVDKVEVYLPALMQVEKKETPQTGLEESAYPHVPGAFSMYASRRGLSTSPPRRRQTVRVVVPAVTESVELPVPGKAEVEVGVGTVEVGVDFATARVLGMVVEALTGAMAEEAEGGKKRRSRESSEAELGVEVVVGEVVMKLVERLKGVFVDEEEQEGEDGPVVVECALKEIKVVHSILARDATSTKFSIKQFTLGDGIADILSFITPPPPPVPPQRKRNSYTPPPAPAPDDITVVFSQSPSKRRINIATLPLKLRFDLKRLEETLGAFGGVGGVLASTSTTASTVTLTRLPEPEKVVGVDTKVACQVGGVVVEIVGTTGKIGVETSAVKVRSEGGGVVVAIEKIGLFAPDLPWDGRSAGAKVEVEGVRVEFLASPRDEDLARLLELLTPSKDQWADDDDILIDTLLRQRQQGSALRIGVGGVRFVVENLGVVARLKGIGEEVVKVLTVTDFVAQDERPGLLTLLRVDSFYGRVDVGGGVGLLEAEVRDVGVAHVSAPALVAVALGRVVVRRNGSEELVGEALERRLLDKSDEGKSMIMVRIVGDEPEPVVKLKLWNLRVEYRVETLMALTTATPPEKVTTEVLANQMAMSIISVAEKNTREDGPPLGVDVLIRDCVLGLNPLGLKSRGLVVLTDARLQAALPSRGLLGAGVEVKKAFVMLIDDTANLAHGEPPRRRKPKVNRHHDGLASLGYVSVVEVSSARVTLQIVESVGGEKAVDLEVHDDLLLMESCADSTATLLGIVDGLKPPLVEEEAVKYCTEIMEVDMFRSLTEDAFRPSHRREQEWHPDDEDDGDMMGDDLPMNHTFVESYYGHKQQPVGSSSHSKDELADSMLDGDLGSIAPGPRKPLGVGEKGMFASFTEQVGMCDTDPLNYVEDHFGKARVRSSDTKKIPGGPTVQKWDSVANRYVASVHPRRAYFPLRVKVRDVHLIWNLHDGYDWPRTRDTISAAVKRVEYKAAQRRDSRRVSFDVDDDEESVIGDFLFNSIYIGIPANRDPKELSKAIAKDFDDHMSETSFAPSSINDVSSRPSSRSRNAEFSRSGSSAGGKSSLKLSRSKTHKLQFELKGVCVDFLLFPPDAGETQSSVDVRVRDLEIIDNVPTSTWKKFVTYMQDAGGRETGSSMVHLEVMNVKPVPDLAASEIVLKVCFFLSL